MYVVTAVFVTLIAICESLNCNVGAPLPKNDPPIDLHKFKGTWYETVTTFDPISMDHACAKISNLHWTINGHGAKITFHYDNGQDVSFGIHIRDALDGYFSEEMIEKNEDLALQRDEFGNIDPKTKADSNELHKGNFTLIGIPDRYVANIRCTPTGWKIWAFTKENTVTPEQLLFIHNDLLKHGISAPLRLGRCKVSSDEF